MKGDVVIVFSNSGQTDEILKLLPQIRKIGAKLIAVTGNSHSTLARLSDAVLNVTVKKEACPLNLAPTASTTAMLALGDALSLALLERKGFKAEDFAFYHPGGNLGKKLLLKVSDIMRSGKRNPIVREDAKIKEVLYRITKARAGSATVVDGGGRLRGIFTDGDLRRHLRVDVGARHAAPLLDTPIKEVMTRNPVTVLPDRLATEALEILRQRKIDEIPVVDSNSRPIGLLDVQDLLDAGIV